MLEGVLLLGLISAVSFGMTSIMSSNFSALSASKEANQAQQLAEVDANLLRLVKYDELDSATALSDVKLHTGRSAIQSTNVTGWEDEIKIGSEQTNGGDGDDGVFRIATINIYRKGESLPKYSVSVPLVKGAQGMTRKEILEITDQLQSNINQLETNVNAYEKATNATLANHQAAIKKNADTIAQNLTYLKGLVDKNAAAIAAANVNINKNAASINTINTKIQNIQNQISGMNTTINSLKTNLSNLTSSLNSEISSRKNADTNLQNQINTNKGNISKNTSAIASLKSNVSTLQSQCSQLRTDITNITGRLNGNELVKNDSTSNRVSFKYDATAKKLQAYVDNKPLNMLTDANSADHVDATASNGETKELVHGTMASNDAFRILVGGGDDAGYVSFDTSDNGNEPIYVRQYFFNGGPIKSFSKLARSATLLGTDGSTSFPVSVTAPDFYGRFHGAVPQGSAAAVGSLDTLYKEGFYTYGNNTTSSPESSWGRVLVTNSCLDGDAADLAHWISQTAYATNGWIYHRTKTDGGAWTGWRKI